MSEPSKINEIIATSLEKVRSLADAKTIIGDPISTPAGTIIIPVSKVSIGMATGGLDYNGKGSEKPANFGGGGGTGVSISPVAFLVISPSGVVELLTVANPSGDSIDKIAGVIDRAPDLLERLKGVFHSRKKDSETDSLEAE